MLSLAIPKGSLEEKTFWLFDEAGLKINRSSNRSYMVSINDPRIKEVLLLRPQEIPEYVASGDFEMGITGIDWIKERGFPAKIIADLVYSKTGWNKVKIVLATDKENPVDTARNINSGARIMTEYPRLTGRFFRSIDKGNVEIKNSFGATEGKVPKLAQYFVDITETGNTLRINGKKILAVIMESSTCLIANRKAWMDPEKRKSMQDVAELLLRVVRAQNRMLVKFNVAENKLADILEFLPALDKPTISSLSSGKKYAVETVVAKAQLNIIIPELKKKGAKGILEMEIKSMIP